MKKNLGSPHSAETNDRTSLKTMKNIPLFFILIFLMEIQSCKDSSDPVIPIDSSFIYPLEIGNTWTYHVSTTLSNIQPDSIKKYLTNRSEDLQVSVTKNILLDSLTVYEMKEESENYPDYYAYYSNQEERFVKYAYRNSAGRILPKKIAIKNFRFHGISFNHVSELINELGVTKSLSKALNDSIIYFQQPRIVLLYPLEIGSEWMYSSAETIIDKKVMGKETVKTDVALYECYKIQRIYDYDDFIYYEYVGSDGLIKTVLTVKNIAITTVESPEVIGHADMKYTVVLTDINF